jgi:hypothetical protein
MNMKAIELQQVEKTSDCVTHLPVTHDLKRFQTQSVHFRPIHLPTLRQPCAKSRNLAHKLAHKSGA